MSGSLGILCQRRFIRLFIVNVKQAEHHRIFTVCSLRVVPTLISCHCPWQTRKEKRQAGQRDCGGRRGQSLEYKTTRNKLTLQNVERSTTELDNRKFQNFSKRFSAIEVFLSCGISINTLTLPWRNRDNFCCSYDHVQLSTKFEETTCYGTYFPRKYSVPVTTDVLCETDLRVGKQNYAIYCLIIDGSKKNAKNRISRSQMCDIIHYARSSSVKGIIVPKEYEEREGELRLN